MKLKYNYTIMCDLKAELKLSPAEREQALRAPHREVVREERIKRGNLRNFCAIYR